ncbi:MAG: hypothetical protein ACYTEQ_30340 [Planctomycetota bacterium]|jgi:hypothetical protein
MAFPQTFTFSWDVVANPRIDLMVWLRAYFLTRQDIIYYTGGGNSARIYTGQMPDGETYKTLIVMDDLGGSSDKDIPYNRQSIQLRIYGSTMAIARELERQVHQEIHGIVFRGDDGETIIPMQEVTGQLLMDPDLNEPWWYMLTSYEFVLRYNTE